jgi:hypothetical protein
MSYVTTVNEHDIVNKKLGPRRISALSTRPALHNEASAFSGIYSTSRTLAGMFLFSFNMDAQVEYERNTGSNCLDILFLARN